MLGVLRKPWRLRLALWSVALVVSTGSAGSASLEREVKATFLYKFAPFVDWPAGSLGGVDTPFVICISGDEAMGGLVKQAAAGQRLGDHPIVVRIVSAVGPGSGCM